MCDLQIMQIKIHTGSIANKSFTVAISEHVELFFPVIFEYIKES